jgi:hypothetical protein
MRSTATPSGSPPTTPMKSLSKAPQPSTPTMSTDSQTASPRDSTFRRKTAAVLADSMYFSRSAFYPDDDEFDAPPTPSKIALPESPSPFKKPVASPGLSTLKRQNRELLSQFKFDEDEDEEVTDMSVTPTKSSRTNLVGSTRGAPVRTLRTSPLKSMAVVGVTDIDITTNFSSIEHSTPLPGPPVFEPPASSASSKTPIQSPGLNTFRRQNFNIVFPDDDGDEEYGLPSVAVADTTIETQSRVSSTDSAFSGGLSESLEIRQRISRVPNYDTMSKFS